MTTYNDALADYISSTFAEEDDILARIRRQIPERGLPEIMLSSEEAAFLHFLAVAIGASRIIEVGTLGGYSGVWLARALPGDGSLTTIDINPEHADVAREHFELAGLGDKVDLRVGDAAEVLPELSDRGPYDMLFLDSDGRGYIGYLEWALDNLRPGGVVAAHNAFAYGGQVLQADSQDEVVQARRRFNQRLANDPRLVSTIFPAGDGISIAAVRRQ